MCFDQSHPLCSIPSAHLLCSKNFTHPISCTLERKERNQCGDNYMGISNIIKSQQERTVAISLMKTGSPFPKSQHPSDVVAVSSLSIMGVESERLGV